MFSALDALRPSLVEMGRAVVRADHRNGAVVLLMWAGILAYLDRCGYDYVTGCVSVPIHDPADGRPRRQIRGVRDFVARRHAAPAEHTVYPYRPVVLDGRTLDEIDPPARTAIPPLMRGYLRLGAQVCGEPAHDPDFGVGGFPGPAGQAPGRHPLPHPAAVGVGRRKRRDWSSSMTTVEHPWLPRASCDADCVRAGGRPAGSRGARRAAHHPADHAGAGAVPGAAAAGRSRCRAARICSAATAGWCCAAWACESPCPAARFATCAGVLVVSGHVSWVDIFAIGAVLPGSFVAKAEMISWPALGALARLMKVIPIERTSLRRLPAVVDAVAARLRAGQTVVAFPEGTTWCGLALRTVPSGDVPGRRSTPAGRCSRCG